MPEQNYAQQSRDVSCLLERIDKNHSGGYMVWITAAWAAMLIKQKIVPADATSAVAKAILNLMENPVSSDGAGPHCYETDRFFIDTLGPSVGGNLFMGRTQPSSRQMLEVRHELLKQMLRVYDLLDAIIGTAEKHTESIMPGYTHFHHAQPTTFGHYLMSVYDAIARSVDVLEKAYSLMNLCELGCGALAGTSWEIDRDQVSAYLGMDGLIENTNDAVCYTDGYLVLACGLTNITNIASRLALDLSYWSGVEYGFIDVGHIRGTSFMMPQKEGNPNSMEMVRTHAGQMIGFLSNVAVSGLRTPHGDVFEMLHIAVPALAALRTAEICTTQITNEMRKINIHKERMLSLIQDSYIGSTELANQIVRDYAIGYRSAHDIVHQFVKLSKNKGIPASRAQSSMLNSIAQEILGYATTMTDERLRELLDPYYFIKKTNSRGGVAPIETARMISERKETLSGTWARHIARIEKVENAKCMLREDLRKLII